MNIITVTLSPATDIYLAADNLELYKENHLKANGRYCGGKGINISKALASCGIESTAVVAMPKESNEEYKRALSSRYINYLPFLANGSVRENITIRSLEGNLKKETRLSISASNLDSGIITEIIDELKKLCSSPSIVVISGSLPQGVRASDLLPFFEFAKDNNVKVVLDSRSYSLDDITRAKPCLIKPNAEECKKYIGQEPQSISDGIIAVKLLNEITGADILLSLGEKGAILLYGGVIYTSDAPKINVASTVGAGDSMLAGFLYALSEGLPSPEALRYAVAYGSAKCQKIGTLPPDKEDIIDLLNKINIKSEDFTK